MREGWKCPVCNRGLSPNVQHCDHVGVNPLALPSVPFDPLQPGWPGYPYPRPIGVGIGIASPPMGVAGGAHVFDPTSQTVAVS